MSRLFSSALTLAVALPLFGATVFVDLPIGVNYFKPRSVVINVGDTVTWRNPTGGGFHGVQSDDNTTFSQATQNGPWTYSFTFTQAGTYPYYCQIHGAINGQGMSGIIFVGNRTAHAANERVLTLNAWDFNTFTSADVTGISNGYRTGGGVSFIAGLHLPSGSEIVGLEMTSNDTDGGADVSASLKKYNDPDGLWITVGSPATSSGTFGTAFVSTTIPPTEIVDNLGGHYFVQVDVGGNTKFRDVRVYYREPVSFAPATATFTDVPTTHPFFKFVEALYAAGVTGGCNASPPQYCPDTPVTRGQMAVFLAQALGLYWPN